MGILFEKYEEKAPVRGSCHRCGQHVGNRGAAGSCRGSFKNIDTHFADAELEHLLAGAFHKNVDMMAFDAGTDVVGGAIAVVAVVTLDIDLCSERNC